ncbi:ABC transporter ATP-binding protein [Pseudovibrio sp. Tun.PSC04-5.I4]|uniref:ABC transporter ATP-binding protein n=1 Tax=Pseudovibrio sp. Tun.PSC04-5.I4 TaxID=1798213 RepID=UPI00088E7F2A|nr:ABC transporter ATP-binding protein [Pseudovibrio sp. Tun.PSC04-5.I4]SDQ74252.1 iron complex transport system ATP-binding protein [Pseudovibrio sp. Tun.PSC04-5.I4]
MTLFIEDLTAGYGRTPILKNISFPEIEPGQLVGLIGPNAAGKSTLFKAITGLIKPTAGTLLLQGQNLAKMRMQSRSRLVAYMPQTFHCNAYLSVFESILLALKQTSGWRVSNDNIQKVEQILGDLGLLHLANRGLSELSGGQSQMVAVARTLVREPKLILLDEPTSALDMHHQLSIMTAIRQSLASNEISAMIALHDLNLAAEFCDRLILVREGEILADGLPADVLALPEVDQTYKVSTQLERTKRGSLYVDAQLIA